MKILKFISFLFIIFFIGCSSIPNSQQLSLSKRNLVMGSSYVIKYDEKKMKPYSFDLDKNITYHMDVAKEVGEGVVPLFAKYLGMEYLTLDREDLASYYLEISVPRWSVYKDDKRLKVDLGIVTKLYDKRGGSPLMVKGCEYSTPDPQELLNRLKMGDSLDLIIEEETRRAIDLCLREYEEFLKDKRASLSSESEIENSSNNNINSNSNSSDFYNSLNKTDNLEDNRDSEDLENMEMVQEEQIQELNSTI
ncbi:MAG: hypothetical protein GXO02_04955, partial [Epsilonproteobacteria bacterium]|nr:hypothetical protein [Campylobacterota bacterium]